MGWLCLSRKLGETLNIGESVVIVNRIHGNRVTFGILAPDEVKVRRGELIPDAANQREADCGQQRKGAE
jgi:carbon storage regulator CsrA